MFHRCQRKEDALKLFRKLCKYLHPDTGGDHESFILLNEAYETCQILFRSGEVKQKTQPVGDPGAYENATDKIQAGDERLNIIEEMKNYAKKHKKFKLDHVESIEEYLQQRSYITSAQYNSMVKIYYAFRMDEEQ